MNSLVQICKRKVYLFIIAVDEVYAAEQVFLTDYETYFIHALCAESGNAEFTFFWFGKFS